MASPKDERHDGQRDRDRRALGERRARSARTGRPRRRTAPMPTAEGNRTAPTRGPAPCKVRPGGRSAYWMTSRVAGSICVRGRDRGQGAVGLEGADRGGERIAQLGVALGVVDAVGVVMRQRVGDLVLVGVADHPVGDRGVGLPDGVDAAQDDLLELVGDLGVALDVDGRAAGRGALRGQRVDALLDEAAALDGDGLAAQVRGGGDRLRGCPRGPSRPGRWPCTGTASATARRVSLT